MFRLSVSPTLRDEVKLEIEVKFKLKLEL